MAVDGLGAVDGVDGALAADEAGDFAGLVVHVLPVDFGFESVEEIVEAVG